MYDTFKKFADEMMFSRAYIHPDLQNHPMPSERMAALAELVKTPYWDKKDNSAACEPIMPGLIRTLWPI